MSLLAGNVTLRRFLVLGPVPEESDLIAGLAQDRYTPFESGLEEERLGWVDWRNPLITPADPDWMTQDRFAVFSLRIDTRKVPPALLKAHVALRIQALMKEKDLAFLGKDARISLEDDVKQELLPKEQPKPHLVECVWDLKGGMLWTTASSTKAQGAIVTLFLKAFGCELQPYAPVLMAAHLLPSIPTEQILALDPFDLSADYQDTAAVP